MRLVSRALTATAVAVALAAGAPGWAQAQPTGESIPGAPPGAAQDRLPEGWRISAGELVWSSPVPVGMGGALVEFRSGERTLGVPEASPDHRTFRLRVDTSAIGPVNELQVVAGSRRLDAAGKERSSARRSAPDAVKPPAPLPVNSVDPGVAGKYRTTSGEYTLKSVKLPGYEKPVEMRATVVGPANAPGKRPLALFLHGRHASCYEPGSDWPNLQWPCPPGQKEIPSYRGYQHDQKLLASQGYVTVSISANGINAQDGPKPDSGAQARSSLVRQHLARWAEWGANPAKAPAAVRATKAADLSKVLLVGHSRGGEGVNRAAYDSVSPPPRAEDGYRGPVSWRIRGTVLIGPTIFGHNPAPDVPSMTILPGCDGDVSDLQGQMYLDAARGIGRGTALHSAVYMVGANHNYFNTEWTPGQTEAPANDDWFEDEDRVCGPGAKTRLGAGQQQTAGTTYIAAAARLFLAGDDRVRPLLDGSGRRAPSAGPARVLSHAVGGNRTAAILPDAPLSVANGRVCEQITSDTARACMQQSEVGVSPHFAQWGFAADEPGRNAVRADWTKPGTPVKLTPGRAFSLAGSEALALRAAVPPNSSGTRLDVAVTDTSGKRVRLGRVTVDGLPGSGVTSSHWARELRVPLRAATAAGVDLKRIRSVELTPRSTSGSLWLVDAWGWRPGTPAVNPVPLPRLDVSTQTVKEGDSGTLTHQVNVRATGKGTGVVKLGVLDPKTYETAVRTVKVKAGAPVTVPVTVNGNTRFSEDIHYEVTAKAVRGGAVGGAFGGLLVENDDAEPEVSVAPVADSVTEGGKLTWKVQLSAPADSVFYARFVFLPTGGGPELSTKDVDPQWLSEQGLLPDPEQSMSEAAPWIWVTIPAGETSVEMSVPTITDALTEPEESVRMQLGRYRMNDGTWTDGPIVTGKVTDARQR
ncbi:hypothetical protein ACFYXL_00845 [Streptomyces tsukubensis]|uniref:hypothetical protein n=1 Tax=Streptomyces tsukubensis TaxID=83656 RepID=UPI0036783B29